MKQKLSIKDWVHKNGATVKNVKKCRPAYNACTVAKFVESTCEGNQEEFFSKISQKSLLSLSLGCFLQKLLYRYSSYFFLTVNCTMYFGKCMRFPEQLSLRTSLDAHQPIIFIQSFTQIKILLFLYTYISARSNIHRCTENQVKRLRQSFLRK